MDLDNEILTLLRSKPCRALEIKATLKIGFHKLYPALHRLKKKDLIRGRSHSQQLFYELADEKTDKSL